MTIKNVDEKNHLHIWGIMYNFTEDFIKEKIFVLDVNFINIEKNQENILSKIKFYYKWIFEFRLYTKSDDLQAVTCSNERSIP